MIEILVDTLSEPSARGLADAFSRAVRDGAVLPGQRLPSIRATAKALQLSPTTVSAAWRLLQQANMIVTDGARGTVVAGGTGQGPVRFGNAIQDKINFATNLSSGLPDPLLLPDLAPSLRRLGRGNTVESFLAAPIIPELDALLRTTWPNEPDHLTIADGVTDALDLITMTLLQYGDRVAVENPTYPPLLDLLDSIGAKAVPLALDDEGPTSESVAAAAAAGVRVVFLQARAHDPLGIGLSESRAKALTQILNERDLVIVELDLWGVLSSEPLVSLSSSLATKTIHLRGYSDSHGPDLRLAALGGPAALMERLIKRRHLGQGWTSRLLQRLLLDLLTHAEPAKVVGKARKTYRERRRALTNELVKRGIAIVGDDGPTVWVPVENETVALMILASQGIGVAPGSPHLVEPASHDHIAITISRLAPEDAGEIASAVAMAARPAALGVTR
ncbi:aminotransferase class I/II-fold pyridoxal phosphate-dependent enzyme [Mycolicibacterium sp. P9-64]|uniref:aminotransferase class I/II-fold pyridoxal phosphate-dependent enzyme n=1 Tax=Mycolicibacterium sp. P9-64 TaxID=2024612 RepID=UPI0011F06048|nr:aminotransferase class I/II-fold pyridoxal phosphate-dependent enzyme [Mycolicibacterium sp. P9-64]KAA0085286.1 aminotransferase class I/II-fold pyridoxal phosphate-dependent enzyme [Mycolicibacterium sp. P9-64]